MRRFALSLSGSVRKRSLTCIVGTSALLAATSVSALGVAASAATPRTSGKAASASPINIAIWNDDTGPIANPEITATAKAVVASWDANGGIDGHKVVLTTCDAQGNPNQTAVCGRNAVSSHAVAVVGAYASNDNAIPIVAAAKIPYLPSEADTPGNFTARTNFPFTSGFAQIPNQATLAGTYCSSYVVAAASIALNPFYEGLINAGLKAAGKPAATNFVSIPLTAGDYSPQARQIVASKAQCIIEILTVEEEASLYPLLESDGSTQRLVGNTGTLTSKIISEFPNLTKNALDNSSTPVYGSTVLAPYRAIVAKYSNPKKYDFTDSGAIETYVSYQIFYRAAMKVLAAKERVTKANLLAALSKSSAFNTHGLTPVLDFATPAPYKGYPRLFGASFVWAHVQNGRLQALDKGVFHSSRAPLQAVVGS